MKTKGSVKGFGVLRVGTKRCQIKSVAILTHTIYNFLNFEHKILNYSLVDQLLHWENTTFCNDNCNRSLLFMFKHK
jgi:hypothetical protein